MVWPFLISATQILGLTATHELGLCVIYMPVIFWESVVPVVWTFDSKSNKIELVERKKEIRKLYARDFH